MSPVYPVYSGGLGEGLLHGVDNFIAARRQRRAQDQQDQLFQAQLAGALYNQGRQRAADASQGIHVLAPGETIPLSVSQNIVSGVNIPTAPTVDQFVPDFRSKLSAPTRGAAAPPAPVSRAGAGALNIPGHPDAGSASTGQPAAPTAATDDPSTMFQRVLTSMMGPPVAQPPRYTFGDGFYIDRKPQQDAAVLSRQQHLEDQFTGPLIQAMMKRQDRADKVARLVAAGISPDRAEVDVDNGQVEANEPLFAKPTPGDMTPRAFMVDGKPIEGFADKTGHLFDAHGNRVTGIVTPYTPPKAGGAGAGDPKFQADQRNAILDDFRDSTKDFEKVRSAWEALQGAIKNPSLATPFAVADAYARVANPGAIVRPTTMQMIEDLGSVNQRFRKWVQKNGVNGQLPPDIMRDLVSTIGGMVQENAKTFQRARGQAIQRGQESGITGLDALLPTFDFTNPLAGQAPAAAATGGPPGDLNLGGDTPAVNPFQGLVPRKP